MCFNIFLYVVDILVASLLRIYLCIQFLFLFCDMRSIYRLDVEDAHSHAECVLCVCAAIHLGQLVIDFRNASGSRYVICACKL